MIQKDHKIEQSQPINDLAEAFTSKNIQEMANESFDSLNEIGSNENPRMSRKQ